jgi:uncharacterized repeat protein (TIGR03837 family)
MTEPLDPNAPRPAAAVPPRWDIFCRVIDNFGDAGVSWRLARLLAGEHGLDVTLWIDVPAALARIAPAVVADRPSQAVQGVTIRPLGAAYADAAPADVVIEAFGCGLPDAYAAAMAARRAPPAWFVLEYLSAEGWVDGAHGLPSPHPRLPLARRFWFPGFTAATGGLLRERDLLARRDAFQADAHAQARLWSGLDVPPPAPGELAVSLFCYPNPALPALLATWAAGERPIVCVVPEGVAAEALDQWAAGAPPLPGGAPLLRGRLRLHRIPFVDQDGYDRLLWACGVNFVRGEDSFVRAQWAARPFVWQIYPQAETAHEPKLAAFLDRYTAGLDPSAANAARGFTNAWNGDPRAPSIRPGWLDFSAQCPKLRNRGPEWAAQLATLPELAAGLVRAAAMRV